MTRSYSPRIDSFSGYFAALSQVLKSLPLDAAERICSILLNTRESGNTVFLFGNGGSASLASHFACDLGKGTSAVCSDMERFRVMALTDNVPTITAWANDTDYVNV